MTLKLMAATIAVALLFASSAEAKSRYHHKHRSASLGAAIITCNDRGCSDHASAAPQEPRQRVSRHVSTRKAGKVARQRLEPSNEVESRPVRTVDRSYDGGHIVEHPAGCPWRLFCGCGVSVRVFGHPVRELFLAANWRKFPPAVPASGMVAWNYRHVAYIESVNDDGTAVFYDPNSGGHLTRIHTRSLKGYRVVDPMGSHVASRF